MLPFFQVMIRSKQAQFSIFLIKKRWFKLEVNENQLSNSKIYNNSNAQEQGFIDIDGQSSKESTILDGLRDDLYFIDDINAKINARHLYSDLFGLGRKIAQVATEKRRLDILNVFNQILEELYHDTNENSTNKSNQILNPHIVKSKGRP